MTDVKAILGKMHSSAPRDRELVEKAFAFAQKAHEGDKRASGDPYIEHVAATALTLAELGMGPRTIAAGLLHDTIEDTGVTPQDLEKAFGAEIRFLVEGVTKLGKLKYHGQKRHVESLRKLFVAMAQDIRVLIIKLTDRLHNMRTLEYLPSEKRERKALETIEIYAPLADRLGIGKLRGELEDLSFPYLSPREFKEASKLLKETSQVRVKKLQKIQRTLQKELAKEGIRNFQTDNRIKHVYSFWQKLRRRDMDPEKIYDIAALRIIVPEVSDCYRVLGIVHRLWRPLPGRIKDYIAVPKPNGYQSLHTTIFTGDGEIVEIQIRTEAMHENAEFGIASHVAYKQDPKKLINTPFGRLWQLLPKRHFFEGQRTLIERKEKTAAPTWIKELAETQAELEREDEFLDSLRPDFFEQRIFVFTPGGDVIDLPIGSTPVDFAYAVHSDIGDHMAGAKINGKLDSIETKLENGDIIEIVTKPSAHPTQKWEALARTTIARKHIRAYLQREKEKGALSAHARKSRKRTRAKSKTSL